MAIGVPSEQPTMLHRNPDALDRSQRQMEQQEEIARLQERIAMLEQVVAKDAPESIIAANSRPDGASASPKSPDPTPRKARFASPGKPPRPPRKSNSGEQKKGSESPPKDVVEEPPVNECPCSKLCKSNTITEQDALVLQDTSEAKPEYERPIIGDCVKIDGGCHVGLFGNVVEDRNDYQPSMPFEVQLDNENETNNLMEGELQLQAPKLLYHRSSSPFARANRAQANINQGGVTPDPSSTEVVIHTSGRVSPPSVRPSSFSPMHSRFDSMAYASAEQPACAKSNQVKDVSRAQAKPPSKLASLVEATGLPHIMTRGGSLTVLANSSDWTADVLKLGGGSLDVAPARSPPCNTGPMYKLSARATICASSPTSSGLGRQTLRSQALVAKAEANVTSPPVSQVLPATTSSESLQQHHNHSRSGATTPLRAPCRSPREQPVPTARLGGSPRAQRPMTSARLSPPCRTRATMSPLALAARPADILVLQELKQNAARAVAAVSCVGSMSAPAAK